MKCENCGRYEAVNHSYKIVNGVKTEQHLCEACGRRVAQNIGFFGISGLGDLLSAFGTYNAPRRITVCPVCGTTSEEVLDGGLAGCAECYREFAEILEPAIRNMQLKPAHTGKFPSAAARRAAEAERLQREMDLAREEQRYEDAKVYWERLKKLQAEERPEKGGEK